MISNDGSDPVVYHPVVVNNGIIERNKIYAYNIDIEAPDPTIIGFFGGWDEAEQEYTKQLQVDMETAIVDPTLAWWTGTGIQSTNATNKYYGITNVDALKVLDSTLAPYPAAQHCEDKGDGWYLPSQAQLMAIWIFFEGLPSEFKLSNSSSNSLYWSSTECDSNSSWHLNFFNGQSVNSDSGSTKANTMRVRCVKDVTL